MYLFSRVKEPVGLLHDVCGGARGEWDEKVGVAHGGGGTRE